MFPEKFTIKELNTHFGTDNQCLEYLFIQKTKNMEVCPKCNKKFSFSKVTERKQYQCNNCSYQIAPCKGTIFEKSDTPLKLWFYAIFLFTASKNGVSAKELERQIGVTYKCAYRIAGLIRTLFVDQPVKLKGVVEMDEAYMGGTEGNKHQSKKTGAKATNGKTAVIGAVERGGNVRARVVDDTQSSSLTPFVRGKIEIQSTLMTDDYTGYNNMKYLGYNHNTVNHSQKEYVRDDNHTNTIEGFWSQLKRSIDGTYHMVSPKYLQQYVNEFAWRYNQRSSKSALFVNLIKNI